MFGLNSIAGSIQVIFILVALVHMLIAFVIYRDVVRINRVVKTRFSGRILFFASLYVLFIIGILVAIVLLTTGNSFSE